MQHPKHIIFSDKLVEFSQGEWEKQPRQEIYTERNKGFINQQEIFFIPPGGESKAMVTNRVSRWLQEEILNNLDGSQSVCVVCHGLVIKCLLFHIMNFNDSLIHKIDIDNTSITKLTLDHAGWHVGYINRTPHLES